MLAKASPPFDSDSHIFELKWDGTRCILFVERRGVRLQNRRLADITYRYPELAGLAGQLKGSPLVLDGELVVLKGGRPSFRRLQEREHIVDPVRIASLSRLLPATYVAFDLLYYNGKSLMDRPLSQRRKLLETLFPASDSIILLSEAYGKGKKLFSKAVALGFEGIMAKHMESLYLPGVRSGYWLKVKKSSDIDTVVCGYTKGHGARGGAFGALVLGAYSGGALKYLGRVGTGFDEAALARLSKKLRSIRTAKSPFAPGEAPEKETLWVRPELVVRVGYQELTTNGSLRAPVFKGSREDKPPEDCVL